VLLLFCSLYVDFIWTMSAAIGSLGGGEGGGGGGEDPRKPFDLPPSHSIDDIDFDPADGVIKIKGASQAQRGACAMRLIKRKGLLSDGTIDPHFLKVMSFTDVWNYISTEQNKRQRIAQQERERVRRGDIIRNLLVDFPELARVMRTHVAGHAPGVYARARQELFDVGALHAVLAIPAIFPAAAAAAPLVVPAAAAAAPPADDDDESVGSNAI
jgi:hypothetical protein